MSEGMSERLRKLAEDNGLGDELARETSPSGVRRDCAFCGRGRSAKDDNHAPECPYWDFLG